MTRGYFLGVVFDSCLIQGDTLIDNQLYKKGSWVINEPIPSQEKDFYLREDTTQGKAWVLIDEEEEERLFMDLSLSLGDSFNIRGGVWMTVNGNFVVDSVYFKNEKSI